MEEITVTKTSYKEGTGKNGGKWERWGIKDENDEWYATATFFDTHKPDWVPLFVEGNRLKVAYTSEMFNGRVSRNLTAVEQVGEAPKLGDGSYVKGAGNPKDQRAIFASVALQQAVATMQHTISKDMTPKAVAERVEPLAWKYFEILLRAGRLMDDEDIPFEAGNAKAA